MTIIIADTETNGLRNPSVIWVLGILDYETEEYDSYTGDAVSEGLLRLMDADLVVGHNWRKYDEVHIERLTEGLITVPDERIVDTLELSRKLVKMKNHGLETWGEMFNLPKIKDTVPDFDSFHPAMIPYCERDVRITKLVFDLMMELAAERGLDPLTIR